MVLNPPQVSCEGMPTVHDLPFLSLGTPSPPSGYSVCLISLENITILICRSRNNTMYLIARIPDYRYRYRYFQY